jgi:hypothetical protein
MAKLIVLINEELQIKERIPNKEFSNIEEKTFLDVAKWLTSKYRGNIASQLGDELSGLESVGQNLERAPIKFNVLANDGKYAVVPYSDNVGEWAEKTDTIYFETEPVGGANNSLFNKHAFGVIKNTRFAQWKSLISDSVADGIFAIGRINKENIAYTIRVQPSANYPLDPPIVSTSPPFSDDPCWDTSGVLHYTAYSNGSGSPWNSLVERQSNPLISLIDELLTKYKMGV